ncbi:MAG: hypothetical protein AAF541_23345 [Pseudomonadota bacterium]
MVQLNDADSGVNISSLSNGSILFIWSIRAWVQAAYQQQCVVRTLYPPYQQHNRVDAITTLDECMSVLCACAYRPVSIRSPHTESLSSDEYALVEVLQALQRGQDRIAESKLKPLVAGRLNNTFRRVAQEYVSRMQTASLNFSGMRHLRLVKS